MTLAVKVALNPNTTNQLLPKDKFLDLTEFKAIAEDKSDVGKIMISLHDNVENIAGKGENAD